MVSVVLADFEELGYYGITASTICPVVTPSAKLICMRQGSAGYHFMRYDQETDAWYHKPGTTAILKYKYTPTNDRIWLNEGVNSNGTVTGDLSVNYSSEIYYISYYTTEQLAQEQTDASLFAGGTVACYRSTRYFTIPNPCPNCKSLVQ